MVCKLASRSAAKYPGDAVAPTARARNPPCTATACAAYSKACTGDNRPSRRNGLAGSRCVLLMQIIDRSSHSLTLSNKHIRPEWGMSLRISDLVIGTLLTVFRAFMEAAVNPKMDKS